MSRRRIPGASAVLTAHRTGLLVLGLAALLAPPQAFAQEEKPFTIHGEVRVRGEYNNNVQDFFDTANPPDPAEITALGLGGSDDGGFYWPYRVRIAAEGRFTRNIVGWIEFQNTGVGGGNGDPRHVGDIGDDVYPYQANITINHLWSKNFSATIGRQELVLGSEFMLSDEDFYAGISHDGLSGRWDLKDWDVTVWLTRPDEGTISNSEADETPDMITYTGNADTQDFFGGYAAWTINKTHNLDFYLTNFNDHGVGARIRTVGARYYHDGWDKSQFFWNVELAQQFGTFAQGANSALPDIDASGLGGEGWFGYSWKGSKNAHRVWVRAEYATGDDTATGDDSEGFFNPFGERHNRAGHGDWFHVQNDMTDLAGDTLDATGLVALGVGYTGYYNNNKHEFGAAYWNYSAEQEFDLAPGPAVQNEDELGQAFDVWYGFNMTKNVAFIGSYSALSPGDALTLSLYGISPAVSHDDSVERLYGQVRLRF